MITLHEKGRGVKFPNYDYILDKESALEKTLCNLTPKFQGNWIIVLVGPRIKFVQGIINDNMIPDWIDLMIYMDKTNMNNILLEHPSMTPKKVTWKEEFNKVLADLDNIISVDAKKILYNSYRGKIDELAEILKKLDKECTTSEITKKQVLGKVNVQRIVYASSVLDAFLCKQNNRWALYNKLVHDIGMRIAYYAMYKYSKTLLLDKNRYLHNEDVRNRCVKRVDAILISYCYILFTNSTDYRQLPVILYSLDNRSTEMLERMTNVSF